MIQDSDLLPVEAFFLLPRNISELDAHAPCPDNNPTCSKTYILTILLFNVPN